MLKFFNEFFLDAARFARVSYLLQLWVSECVHEFFLLLLLWLFSVAICWIIIFPRLIFIQVYGQVALVFVAIFVILGMKAMILSKVLISGYQLIPSSPASPSKLSSVFECKLFVSFFLIAAELGTQFIQRKNKNAKVFLLPWQFHCSGNVDQRKKMEKKENVKWKIVFTIEWRWCWFPVNTRTRFVYADSLTHSSIRLFILRTERHSLFRHFECIYRVGRCRVTSPTPLLFGLSLKVLIKKNIQISEGELWIFLCMDTFETRFRGSILCVLFSYFSFPTTCRGPFVYRLVRSMMFCVCGKTYCAVVPFSGHHIEYDIQ